jgi:SCY1-like protein 2
MSTMPLVSRPSRLGAKPVPSSTFDSSGFVSSTLHPSQPNRISSPPAQPQRLASFTMPPPPLPPPQKPNYNVSLSDFATISPSTITSVPNYVSSGYTTLQPTSPAFSMSSPPLHASPLSMGSIMAPTRPTTTARPVSKDDWGDFDPLK